MVYYVAKIFKKLKGKRVSKVLYDSGIEHSEALTGEDITILIKFKDGTILKIKSFGKIEVEVI